MLELVKKDIKENKALFCSELKAKHILPDGKIVNLGVISKKVVTAAFVNFIVDKLVAAGNINLFKYHDCGTRTAAESSSDTALGTPYGGDRAVGTQEEGASANIYKSVGTNDFTSSLAITEHGLFSLSAVGILADRSVFAQINVINGSAIEWTYTLTVQPGG